MSTFLPYHVLAGLDLNELNERIDEAMSKHHYALYGGVSHVTQHLYNGSYLTHFMALVIDYGHDKSKVNVQKNGSPFNGSDWEHKVVFGEETDKFCEEVSALTRKDWYLLHPPQMFLQDKGPMLMQELVRRRETSNTPAEMALEAVS